MEAKWLIGPLRSTDGKLGTLQVYNGISDHQIDQLISYANTEKAIQRFTSDPKRFQNKNSFEKWRQKGRSIYVLENNTGDLLGLIWFGGEEIPSEKKFTKRFDTFKYGVTFAIRIYQQARGKRLARKFMGLAFSAYRQSEEYKALSRNSIWLETSADNIPAVTAYRNFGFHQVTEPDEKNKILMVLEG